MRPADTLARFGGDDFALPLPDGGREAGAATARRIAQAPEASFVLDQATLDLEASIGIAGVDSDFPPVLEDLLRRADIAMYQAKSDRSGFAHFAACNGDRIPKRLTLVGEPRHALDSEEVNLGLSVVADGSSTS